MRSIWAVLLLSFSMFTYADVEISAFEQLKTLVGKWKKEGSDGKQFYISFETTAGGTVLIENWVYKGASHSLTVYHQAGDQLLATHYCPQGNQPRLSSSGLDADGTIAFSFLDVTNLAGPEASHQYALSFKILSEKSLLRKESYKKLDVITPSSLTLVRI